MAVVTESLHATSNRVAQTETPEQPVIRVTAIVVHGPIVTAVVVTDFPRMVGVLSRVRVRATKAADRRAGRHLDRTSRSLSHFCRVSIIVQGSAGGKVARSRRFGARVGMLGIEGQRQGVMLLGGQ